MFLVNSKIFLYEKLGFLSYCLKKYSGKEKLCLYGLVDGSWRVTTPVKLVPADMPEPTVGLNFIRDDWNRKEWLAEVAKHSDAWLYQTAFFKRHKLEDKSR